MGEFEITRKEGMELKISDVEKMHECFMKAFNQDPQFAYKAEGNEKFMIEEFLQDEPRYLSTGRKSKIDQLIIYFLIQYEWILNHIEYGEEIKSDDLSITKLLTAGSYENWENRVKEIENIDRDFKNTLSFFETSEEGIKNYLKYADLYESVTKFTEFGEKLSGELFDLFYPKIEEQEVIVRRI